MSEAQQDEIPAHPKNNSGVFVAVFLMLCALTALSFGIANSRLMDNQLIGWGAMIAVSIAKALLVILFFLVLPALYYTSVGIDWWLRQTSNWLVSIVPARMRRAEST